MARSKATRRAGPTLTGLLMVAALLGGFSCAGEEAATTPAPASTVNATIADTPTTDTDPWLKIVPSGQTQTREGLTITLEGVAVGMVEKVVGETGASAAELGNEWTDAKAVVAVRFEAYNPTTGTLTVPIYTNTKLVANDEQTGIDFLLSDVEVSILSGVREDMQVIAPISRYSAEDIETVRFVLEMSVLASPEETFDFTVAIP
jgi:hypothetical protein